VLARSFAGLFDQVHSTLTAAKPEGFEFLALHFVVKDKEVGHLRDQCLIKRLDWNHSLLVLGAQRDGHKPVNIMRKLKLRTYSDLIQFAIRHEIIKI
jgi:hypothetical protein